MTKRKRIGVGLAVGGPASVVECCIAAELSPVDGAGRGREGGREGEIEYERNVRTNLSKLM